MNRFATPPRALAAPTSGTIRRSTLRRWTASIARRQGVGFAAASLFVSVLNYGVALVVGRWLGPQSYGPFASFMALFLLVTLAPVALQLWSARAAARGETPVGSWVTTSAAMGILLGVASACMPFVAGAAMDLPGPWWSMLAVTAPAYVVLGVARGIEQGRGRLGRLAVNLVLEAVVRAGCIGVLWSMSDDASGAVAGTLLAVPVAMVHLRDALPRVSIAIPRIDPSLVRSSLPLVGYLSAQAVLVHSDVLIANARFEAEAAGIFAAATLVGRSTFFAAGIVTTVAFGYVAARRGRHLPVLLLASAVVTGGAAAAAAISAAAPSTVIDVLFGSGFRAAAPWLAPYAAMSGIYAVAHVIGSHHLALGLRGATLPVVVAAVVQTVALVVTPATGDASIAAQTWVKGGLAVVALIALLRARLGGS